MGPNELLFWLSVRHEGSWPQFRSATEELVLEDGGRNGKTPEGFPLYQRLRFSLQSLAHVEFDAAGCEDGWRVTPPTLALSRQADRSVVGVLCGARLPETIRQFEHAAGSTHECHTIPEQPDIIRVMAPSTEQLMALAASAGIRAQPDAPTAILGCLPHADNLAMWRETPLPFGKDWKVVRFEIGRKSYRWTTSSVTEANQMLDGLFRFTRFQIPDHFLRVGGRTFKVGGQAGKFFLLAKRGRQVLRYDRGTQCLTVPGICRPPLLADRALVLCSGYLPRYDSAKRVLVYREVPEGIAGLAADILRQPGL